MQYILMPFSWLLLFFYHVLNSYGLALILFAVAPWTQRQMADVEAAGAHDGEGG